MFIYLTALNTSYLINWRRVLNSVHTNEYYHTWHLSKEAANEFIRNHFATIGQKVKTDYLLHTGDEPSPEIKPVDEPFGEFISGKK